MSDKYNNLNYQNDNYEDALLEESVDQEEPVDVADLSEEPMEDTLGFLMCGVKGDLFSELPLGLPVGGCG